MKKQKSAFTLAEVVITLIVIGVVSAITIPMLHNDVNDKKWNVGRQKALTTIGEAFKLATVNGDVTPDYTNTKDFATKVLTKYLKINKQCDTAAECGFSSQIKRVDVNSSTSAIPTSWTNSTTAYVISGENGVHARQLFDKVNSGERAKFNNAAFFQTLDGFSIALFFNPYCAAAENDKYFATLTYSNIVSYRHYSLDITCMNAVYDMNGKKGPNQVGKDIGFIGSFYNGFNVKIAAVLPHKNHISGNNLPSSIGANYWLRNINYCKNLHGNDWKIPNVEEIALMYLNRNVLLQNQNVWYWSGIPVAGSSSYVWYIHFNEGLFGDYMGSQSAYERTGYYGSTRCVRM